MKDHPLLFSAPMVRANLDGRKTNTRRILKPQPPEWATFCQQPTMLNVLHEWVPSGLWTWSEIEQDPPRELRRWPLDAEGEHYWLKPRFSVGDRLWVREAWAPLSALTHNDPGPQALADRGFYRADNGTVEGEISRWRPSIHMPRWASRLTLIVTGVKIERLQDISEDDAIAEGVERDSDGWRDYLMPHTQCCASATKSFETLWDSINGHKKQVSWNDNPWVVAYTYEPIFKNIDKLEVAA